jgi:hypothetical protein
MKRNLILTIAILWATAACGPATTSSNTDLSVRKHDVKLQTCIQTQTNTVS